jgi:hypothetical protein
MSIVPSGSNPYDELARLILACDGRPMHMLGRDSRIGGGTRLRFEIKKGDAGPIVALCKRQRWRYTQPSGVQMVVDVPLSLRELQGSRQPSLGEGGQRELGEG